MLTCDEGWGALQVHGPTETGSVQPRVIKDQVTANPLRLGRH